MLERMKEIIAEQLNTDAAAITEESSFKDDLGADSLDLFEIVMAFEEAYGIEIPSEEMEPENFNSAKAIYEMIQRLEEE